MPFSDFSNWHPRALPARFRRQRWLIVGCGDVGSRLALLVQRRMQVRVLTSSPQRLPILRKMGLTPLLGNLDCLPELLRLRALGQRLIYLAPPANLGNIDQRSQNLITALRKRPWQKVIYASTSGVYGDCAGSWVSENQPLQAQSIRAQRRVDAEQRWRKAQLNTSALRLPGIYNETQTQRFTQHFTQNLPILLPQDDVYSNRIHAEDVARACLLAAFRAPPKRNYHICESSGPQGLRWSDLLEQAALELGWPIPKRVDKKTLGQFLSPQRMQFLSESKRLTNQRLRFELGLNPRSSLKRLESGSQ